MGKETSMKSEETIQIILGSDLREVPVGTTVGELLGASPEGKYVGALINHDKAGLDFPLTVPVTVTPLEKGKRDGREILNRTYTHVLEAILAQYFPNLHFQIGQSLQQGICYQLIDYTGEAPDLEKVTDEINEHLQEIVKANRPIEQKYYSVEHAYLTITDKHGSMRKLLDTWPFSRVPIMRLEFDNHVFSAICYGPCTPSTGYCKDIKVAPFPRGFLLQFSKKAKRIDADKHSRLLNAYRESREWNRMIGISTIGDLNEAILTDRITDVVRVQEGLHEKKLVEIANDIASHQGKIKLICVAGPSSSGKTTFVQRMAIQLRVIGIEPVIIGLDDYYRDRTVMDPEAAKKLNLENLEALDTELLTSHLQDIVAGREICVPRFNFKTGGRFPESDDRRIKLAPNQVLLIEGIHGLNPAITEAVPEESRYRIFVSALTQLIIDEHNRIPTSDGRLLRRIVRDRRYRGTMASRTIEMWPTVRAGEERNIFPYQEYCDVMFNSALVYEAAIFKTYAWRYLLEVPHEHPSRVQAQALLRFLDMFVPLMPDDVPSTSVLREFIGGSGFSY